MKVLIVDDIGTNRKLLRVNLEAEGIETVEAADGLEALAVLQEQKADAIISDILMPHMDGYRFCQEVRKDEAIRDTPFIFYTSTYTSPGDEKLALACGADRYIKKPASIGLIMEAIRELSDGQKHPTPAVAPEEVVVMREYNEALIRKLEERNEKLEQARAEIAEANRELEHRVQQRTAELLSANEELEAFSHSIAHDLRSPLTAIYTYSEYLLEECRGKVSERAMDGLETIGLAATRMDDLTRDLLRLAQANRGAISLHSVDLSALATAILGDLQDASPERNVRVNVASGIIAKGDPGLLQITLENLLGNAWKYTGKTAHPSIEFGAEIQQGGPAYFVRDNGAGFDMAAADKLFQTFSRLHSQTEFAGTGIGLSTVQRVISRHGGRIWATASVGQGATFFFTLGPSDSSRKP